MINSFENSGTSTENLRKAQEALDSNEALMQRIRAAESTMDIRAAVMESFDPPIDPKAELSRMMTGVERAMLLEAIRRWNKLKHESQA